MTGDPKRWTQTNAPRPPRAPHRPNSGATERVSTQERIKGRVGCDAASGSRAGSLSEALLVLQPQYLLSLSTKPNKPIMPISPIFCDTDPVWVSQTPRSDADRAGPFPRGARPSPPHPQPLCGAHSPRRGSGTRLDCRRRRGGSAELRSAASAAGEGGQHANHPKPGTWPCRPRCPSRRSAQAVRGGHAPGRAVGRGGRGRRRSLGCRRSAPCSAARAALQRTPPSAACPALAKTRSADAAAGSGLFARPRAPGSAWKGRVGARLRRRGGQDRLCAAGGLSWALGDGLDEVRLGATQVLKCSWVVSSAPPPILRLFFFLTNHSDGLKDRKGEVGEKTDSISSDQTVWGLPIWVSSPSAWRGGS